MKILLKLIADSFYTKGVRYYFLNKIVGTLGAPVSIILVIEKLNSYEQGYYYAFISLLAFQVVAEFGFNAGLMHFISAEWPKLKIKNGKITGPEISLGRFNSLREMGYRWTLATSVTVSILFLYLGNYYFLPNPSDYVDWIVPWRCACFALFFGFIAQFFRSMAEATNHIEESQKAATFGSVISLVCTWVAFIFEAGLYAVAISIFINSIVVIICLYIKLQAVIVRNNNDKGRPVAVEWRREFLPHQIKLGISWLCGFIMFQSFVIFIFKSQGAVAAGKAGILLQIFNLSNAFGFAWVVNSGPKFGELWVNQNTSSIKELVNSVISKSVFTVAIFSFLVLMVLLVAKIEYPEYYIRVDSIPIFLSLAFTAMVMQFGNAYTTVIRYKKKELFIFNSIFGALIMMFQNYYLSLYSLELVFIGFLFTMALFIVPWQYFIYRNEVI